MLRDEPIEYIQEQYNEKNSVLDNYGERVSATTLYEDIFGDTDIIIPVVILDENENEKRIRVMSVSDAIVFGECRNDVLIGGCTYFNNWISKKSAKDIYTFIIDYDNAYSGTLLYALQNDWKSASGEPLAKPTYIVNSGTGLHLYFVLKEPIPNYHSMTANIDKLYRELAKQQAKRVYAELQIQWFGQDFRCAGGLNKYDWENTIYRISDKWDIDELAQAVGIEGVHFTRYGEKRTHKPNPKPHKKRSTQGWKTDKAFYNYSVEACKQKTHEGNRYMSMCALSAIAYKCGVSKEQLEADLLSLLPIYNKGATRIVKEKEIVSAMKMYNERAILAPRESLEHWQGWEYHPIKRNGRKQALHLKIARATLEIMNDENGHALQGRHTKQLQVEQWQQDNPNGTKAECIRETGLSKPTVYKYWVS